MVELGQLADKVRSKNAGPFWVTIDVFCGDATRFAHVSSHLDTGQVADLLDTSRDLIKRFDISDLNVVKLSLPRPVVQGMGADRDMHGAAWAVLLAEMSLPDLARPDLGK